MRQTAIRVALVLSAVSVLGLTVACSIEPDEGKAVACGSYEAEPDVAALVKDSAAVVVGDFSETGESSAEVHVEHVFKGVVNPGDTIRVSWVSDCGSPIDFLTASPGATEEFAYFLGREGRQYRLIDGPYGMFNASDALLGEVSAATGQ